MKETSNQNAKPLTAQRDAKQTKTSGEPRSVPRAYSKQLKKTMFEPLNILLPQAKELVLADVLKKFDNHHD